MFEYAYDYITTQLLHVHAVVYSVKYNLLVVFGPFADFYRRLTITLSESSSMVMGLSLLCQIETDCPPYSP